MQDQSQDLWNGIFPTLNLPGVMSRSNRWRSTIQDAGSSQQDLYSTVVCCKAVPTQLSDPCRANSLPTFGPAPAYGALLTLHRYDNYKTILAITRGYCLQNSKIT